VARTEQIIVIGGVAAGMTAALRVRRVNPAASITVIDAGSHVAYGACGIPLLLAGIISDWRSLLARTPAQLNSEHIELRAGHRGLAIDAQRRTIDVVEISSGQAERLSYDRLILATGARSVWASAPDLPAQGIYTLSTLADGLLLATELAAGRLTAVGVLGWGPRAWTIADALRQRGCQVTLFRPAARQHSALAGEPLAWLEHVIRSAGIAVVDVGPLPLGPGEIHPDPARLLQQWDIPRLVVAAGYWPDARLAVTANIALGPRGGILVDRRMQTSDSRIFAAGDCAEPLHMLTGTPAYLPGALNANRMGRLAGISAGTRESKDRQYAGGLGTGVTRVFGCDAAWTGLSNDAAEAAGLTVDVTEITHGDRASYAPGADLISVRLICQQETGRLLGGALVGPPGAAKRIDTLAVAVQAQMSAAELAEADLGYHPVMSPVWDPVLIAARIAAARGNSA